MASIPVRQGATLVLHCVHKVGTPPVASSIAGMTITGHIRDYQNYFKSELTFAALPGVGEFTLTATADETELWPTGNLYWDIRMESPGNIVQISTKQMLVVSRPVTLENPV